MRIERPKYLDNLISRMHTDQAKVVTGVRRCGKSYLIFEIFKDYLLKRGVSETQIFEMAFDRYGNRRYRDSNVFYPYVISQIETPGMHYVLLDEVQLLEHFEEVLIDLIARENVDVYVTGSNAKLLSKDIVTEFRGRGDEVRMAPLSFAEFMTTYDDDIAMGWQSYLMYGGLPAVACKETREEKIDYLQRLFSEIYINDIIERNSVRNNRALDELLNVMASTIGSLTNPNKLSDTFHSVTRSTIDPETVSSYIDYFDDAFLLERAQRYDIKGRRYIGAPYKYYFSDLGLRNARLGFRQFEETHLMENAIYNELRARGYSVDIGNMTVSERDKHGKSVRKQLEVDFVCNNGSERIYIQSAYDLPDSEKLAQEQRSLLKTGDSFRKVIVVGKPIERHYTDEGILLLSVYDFMLDESALH
ncbi:ATP-binding protein [Atopobium sp. oral taxon 810]|uniref:ATP-binding protein n=1 Tax=Atopobium sp. oral taxon 810 TaxID=712158 RepID=UPI00054DDFC3|nr:ATP-binding protein [Atopobium sp. oral taxon 810]